MKTKIRIDQLDGLRGIAIILVILNHMRLDPLFALLPVSQHIYLGLLTSSGKIGVATLFMLSGYLMATIYPTVRSKFDFWQKRYTRIFPGFITMCVALVFIRLFWKNLPLLIIPAIVIGSILLCGWIWKKIQAHPQRTKLAKVIFSSFAVFQVLTAIFYIFLLPRLVPSAVFFQVWQPWQQSIVTFIINATMTLPLGKYIGQLDGVYWSVLTEIFFYLCYPIIFLPLFSVIQAKNSVWLSTLVTLLLFPFFYGLSLLFKEILGLQMMYIHFAIYFTFGMIIANVQDLSFFQNIRRALSKLPALLLILFSIIILISSPLFMEKLNVDFYIGSLIWVLPVSLVFFLTLEPENGWSRFLQLPLLTKAGKISYSIYLTHTIALEMYVRMKPPADVREMIWNAVISLGTMFVFAYLLHIKLERPYFNKDSNLPKSITLNNQFFAKLRSFFVVKPIVSLAGIVVTLLFLVWYGFRVPVPLLTHVVNHSDQSIPYHNLITTKPLLLSFTGQYPNLGMILLSLKPLSQEEVTKQNLFLGRDAECTLDINVKDKTDSTLVSSQYKMFQIFESRFHPVGLPLQADSQNKKLTISLQSSEEPRRFVNLVNDGITFRTIYFLDRKEILKHPIQLLSLLIEKLTQPFMEHNAQMVLLFLSPLMGVLLIAQLQRSLAKQAN